MTEAERHTTLIFSLSPEGAERLLAIFSDPENPQAKELRDKFGILGMRVLPGDQQSAPETTPIDPLS